VLRDSLINIKNKDIINEYNSKYESEQKERTIAELELDKKNAALALSSSNNQRNIFIFIAALIIFIALFLYYLYNTKRKTSDILALKNSQISKALDEREVLLKEIHHRVKNNLQVIWSLLRLQGRSLKDKAAIEALTQGQNRVKSMALIHQKLYSTDDLRGVSVQDYFEKLTTELFIAFGVTHVEHKIETGHIKLDIDTMIPLGLIVNELMTNAIKYAFSEMDNGLLELLMFEENEKLVVQLKDNGVGMDEEGLKSSNSFGWKMIRSLSRELKAEIEISNNQGTTINLRLSRYKLVE
jgi:two-component sensor histidine kinase